ncbi:SIR2 family protein [Butyrivibrio sp. NC2007]|uniref:SIR2 family protein n=1 Tax=Butyrivibrio sp. NC2007 TaxID=1280683 RepID=UPI0003B73199|nr:SIR2 family protein [Butyrivibrio sp. NC2007]
MQRITVILGAGAMIEATGVSTWDISKRIFNKGTVSDDKEGIVSLKRKICKKIYEMQSHNRYEGKWNSSKIADVVNFEEYFNVLELLYSYITNKNSTYVAKEYLSPHLVFTDLNVEFENMANQNNKAFDSLGYIVRMLLKEVVLEINEIVYAYNKEFASKGNKYKKFFNTIEKELNCRFDIFNLNYDTWPQFALPNYNDGYVDEPGYESFMRFRPEVYLKDDDRNRVSNLHGQIFFEEPNYDPKDINRHAYDEPRSVLYKYKNFNEVQKYRKNIGRSGHLTQQREDLHPANIITGLMKADKLLQNPFDVYQMELFNCLLHNRKLIIIGYGFGDYYLNSMLNTYLQVHLDDKKVLVIDKKTEEKWNNYRYGLTQPSLSESAMITFLARAFKEDGWRYRRKYAEFMYSSNKDSCYSVVGFAKAASKKRLSIVTSFLK